MFIDRLSIHNFRNFETLQITFDPKLTVIVARNGQGKTAILDAATIALGTFVGAFDLGKAKHFHQTDARYSRLENTMESEQHYPVTLKACFLQDMWVTRELTGKKSKTTIKGAAPITDFGKHLMQQVRNLEENPLPVIAYYGSGRLWNAHKNMERKSVLSESRTMGYEDCLSPASHFTQVQQWMAKATYGVMQQQHRPEYSGYNLSNQIAGITEAVNNMLTNEGWNHFHYSMIHEELVMSHKDHGILPVSILSDGVRSMVSLAADLAWRCVKLNPHKGVEAPTHNHGIVFIDEIDSHLHPGWQQKIIHNLQKSFPNIQFIATTHSPQVLTTVPDRCIRILQDGQVYAAPPGTEGAEASRLLKRVLGIDVRPTDHAATKELLEYLTLVDENKWDTPHALEIRKKLDTRYKGEEPALLEADLRIENALWE